MKELQLEADAAKNNHKELLQKWKEIEEKANAEESENKIGKLKDEMNHLVEIEKKKYEEKVIECENLKSKFGDAEKHRQGWFY